MIKQTIRYYLGFEMAFEFAFSFLAAVYIMFLLGRGLNLLEINLVNLAFFLTKSVFEVPTGLFADTYGRKLSYVLACVLIAVGKLVYAASYTFAGFVAAEMIIAVGMTFASGAFKAWMVDRLYHFGYQEPMHHIFAKRQYVIYVARIFGALLGAYVADINWIFHWLFSSSLMICIALAAMVLLKEEYSLPKKKHMSFKKKIAALKEKVRTCTKRNLSNKVLRFLIIVSFVQMLAVSAPNMQWQPFFAQYWTSAQAFSYVWVAIVLFSMLGTWLAMRVSKYFTNERNLIVLCLVGTGIGIATTTLFNLPISLVLFLMHEVTRGALEPLRDAYLQKNISSDYRATLDSVSSTGNHIGGAIGLLASGLLAQYASITTAWVCSGIFLISVSILLWERNKE